MTELQELHNETCHCAEEIMAKMHNVDSFFRVMVGRDKYTVITPWQNDMEKKVYVAGMRVMFREPVVDAYSFVTEAWEAHVDPRTQKELMNVKPRDRSDREDILVVITRGRTGGSYVSRYHVEYDAEGRVTLGPSKTMEGEWTGLMGNLFEDPR